jgi:hypothetical protein
MSRHPINLAVRFLLELAAWATIGVWGWQKGEGWTRFLLAVGLPLLAMALWGIFRVPGDPGKATVAVPGAVRLTFEVVFFGFAIWALFDRNLTILGWALGAVTLAHYLTSYDRVVWLLKQ